MKKIVLVMICIFTLTGCNGWQETQKQNIEKCKNNGGKAIVKYCNGNSNDICTVTCILNDEEVK